jgi:hypothetical protein
MRPTLAELHEISGRDVTMQPKFKSDIILEFKDAKTGRVNRRRQIHNTRLWWAGNLFMHTRSGTFGNYVVNQSNTKIVICNDDSNMDIHKNVFRCSYEDNAQNFFVGTLTSHTKTLASKLWTFVASFPAPLTESKTINIIAMIYGLTNAEHQLGTYAWAVGYGFAATKLPTPETQLTTEVLDITYKITLTI